MAARQHGAVAAWQLLQIGFTRAAIKARLAAGRLQRLHEGVYAVGHGAVSGEGHWMAAVLACGPDAVLSHRSAATLYGLMDFGGGAIEVTLPGIGGRSRPGIRIHRTHELGSHDRAVLSSIPVTSVARTLFDLAATIAPRHLRRCYEEAERLEILDLAAVGRIIDCHPGRRGIRVLRELADYDPTAAARAHSELERLFLDFCSEEGLPLPLVNTRVAGYEVDMLWPEAKLIVELDGYEYHRGRHAFERDRAKAGDLKLAGYEVMPVTYRRLTREGARVKETILSLLNPQHSRREADIGR